MYIAHGDPQPNRNFNRRAEYRKAYNTGLTAKTEHPDWSETDARNAASAYSAPHMMNDGLAVVLWDGYYHGATGTERRY